MVRLTIKEIAAQRGIKQGELAAKSGVTPQLLNRYWHNNTLRVELEQLGKIAKALGVKPGDLIVSDEEVPAKDKPMTEERPYYLPEEKSTEDKSEPDAA